jgi:uncharacterized protein YecE (DUF72 family)
MQRERAVALGWARMPVHIGTSGWQYKDWRERFYETGLPQKRWLEFYAERFHVVESNSAFYRLPNPETFASWADRTPDDFVMAVKVNRYITHIKRLRDCAEPVQRFVDHATMLGSKLGPVLLQLPPNLKVDLESLEATLDAFSEGVQVAVEFRHHSWYHAEVKDFLTGRGAALCLADRGSRPVTPVWRTANWTYLRFHEGAASPPPCYGRASLKTWAERLSSGWADQAHAWVFFNNDPGGCAVRDARIFARECSRAGLRPTRVPDDAVPVG